MDETFAFPAQRERVREARLWARGRVPAESAEDVGLIVSELAANAVLHGAAGDVRLRLTAVGGRLRITVTNPGGGRVACPVRDPLDENGRGLTIVAALAARSGVRTARGLTEAWAEIPIPIPGAEHVADEPQPPTTAQPSPNPECPGRGRPHLVATASGPGGRATRCIACDPPRPEVPMMSGAIRSWTYDEIGPDGQIAAYVTVRVPPGEERPARLADVPPEWIENRKPAYRAT